jgi:hypothetical protein
MAKIHVLHENAAWVVPLEAALREQDLPFEMWFLDRGSVDLAAPPPDGVFYNRMSASSHTRGHRFAPELTQVVLTWLERHGRRVVNSSRALALEVSKVAQYAALERAGIAVPRTVAAVGREEVLEAARRFGETPFILKPNRGGKGLGVQLVSSPDALAAILDDPGESAPIDGVWLIQEYVRPERPVITRCEFIGGRFLYAVEVDASQGFELCPADVCATDAPAAIPKFRILLGGERRRRPAHNRRRGFPTGPRRPPDVSLRGCKVLWVPFCCAGGEVPSSDRRSWLDHPGDGLDEAHHLTGDRGDHHHLGLAGRRQAPVALAESELGLPGEVADRLGQALEPIEQFAADPRLHAVGPGTLDQDASGLGIAGLG